MVPLTPRDRALLRAQHGSAGGRTGIDTRRPECDSSWPKYCETAGSGKPGINRPLTETGEIETLCPLTSQSGTRGSLCFQDLLSTHFPGEGVSALAGILMALRSRKI